MAAETHRVSGRRTGRLARPGQELGDAIGRALSATGTVVNVLSFGEIRKATEAFALAEGVSLDAAALAVVPHFAATNPITGRPA